MHQASETIGTIAAALAKAQAEIANPEKSLSARIRSPSIREAERTFRYAPLASGLDIVRKCLGRHEIAIVQTTQIDKDAGLIRLTTVLAHSSGEWLSSDWPVCPVSETASPHRMGAALTYARRYALFTLVGIAGEDDLDAPDLSALRPNGHDPGIAGAAESTQTTERKSLTTPAVTHGSGGHSHPGRHRTILAPDVSAALRDRLLTEIAGVSAATNLTDWAHRNLPTKNTLTAADARMVEHAFEALMETLSDASVKPVVTDQSDPRATAGPITGHHGSKGPVEKLRRKRDKAHVNFVASQPCLICGRAPADAHHLRFVQPRALGRKVSDEHTVPLCRVHHRELHRHANEIAWWTGTKVDPLDVARTLWQKSHGPQDRQSE